MRERCGLCGRYLSVPPNIKAGDEIKCPNCEADLIYDPDPPKPKKKEEK